MTLSIIEGVLKKIEAELVINIRTSDLPFFLRPPLFYPKSVIFYFRLFSIIFEDYYIIYISDRFG